MLFFALLLCLWTSSRASIEPIDPSSRRFAILYKWADRHRQYVEQAKAQHSVAFYGDSITYKLSEDKSWNKTYAPMGAANYGLRADRTEHLLWRIQNGELDGPPATVLVLLIGTNNLINTKDAEIVAGIRLIRQRIIPSVSEYNTSTLQQLVDSKHIHFLDIGHLFLGANGEISKSIMMDYLHLTPAGYAIWEHAMHDKLLELLEAARKDAR